MAGKGEGERPENPREASELDKIIGQRIRTARVLRGVTQETVASKIGLTFQQLQKYENGVNRVSAGRLKEIADILGLSVLWFYGDDDPSAGSEVLADLPSLSSIAVSVAKDTATLPVSIQRQIAALVEAIKEDRPASD